MGATPITPHEAVHESAVLLLPLLRLRLAPSVITRIFRFIDATSIALNLHFFGRYLLDEKVCVWAELYWLRGGGDWEWADRTRRGGFPVLLQ